VRQPLRVLRHVLYHVRGSAMSIDAQCNLHYQWACGCTAHGADAERLEVVACIKHATLLRFGAAPLP
jgi:hypothetical protein